MKLMVMTYVSDMARSVAFYESLGLRRAAGGEIDPMWTELAIGGSTLALHGAKPDEIPDADGHLQLNINVAAGELDRLYALCDAEGHTIGAPIQEMGFGRFFQVKDPDGLPVQFNEHRG
jgi:catechol 2,3-dioxygenase-like lactoylglutathione lyase family enzyme